MFFSFTHYLYNTTYICVCVPNGVWISYRVRQGHTEFNSVQTEYGNHVVIFLQLSLVVISILSRPY